MYCSMFCPTVNCSQAGPGPTRRLLLPRALHGAGAGHMSIMPMPIPMPVSDQFRDSVREKQDFHSRGREMRVFGNGVRTRAGGKRKGSQSRNSRSRSVDARLRRDSFDSADPGQNNRCCTMADLCGQDKEKIAGLLRQVLDLNDRCERASEEVQTANARHAEALVQNAASQEEVAGLKKELQCLSGKFTYSLTLIREYQRRVRELQVVLARSEASAAELRGPAHSRLAQSQVENVAVLGALGKGQPVAQTIPNQTQDFSDVQGQILPHPACQEEIAGSDGNSANNNSVGNNVQDINRGEQCWQSNSMPAESRGSEGTKALGNDSISSMYATYPASQDKGNVCPNPQLPQTIHDITQILIAKSNASENVLNNPKASMERDSKQATDEGSMPPEVKVADKLQPHHNISTQECKAASGECGSVACAHLLQEDATVQFVKNTNGEHGTKLSNGPHTCDHLHTSGRGSHDSIHQQHAPALQRSILNAHEIQKDSENEWPKQPASTKTGMEQRAEISGGGMKGYDVQPVAVENAQDTEGSHSRDNRQAISCECGAHVGSRQPTFSNEPNYKPQKPLQERRLNIEVQNSSVQCGHDCSQYRTKVGVMGLGMIDGEVENLIPSSFAPTDADCKQDHDSLGRYYDASLLDLLDIMDCNHCTAVTHERQPMSFAGYDSSSMPPTYGSHAPRVRHCKDKISSIDVIEGPVNTSKLRDRSKGAVRKNLIPSGSRWHRSFSSKGRNSADGLDDTTFRRSGELCEDDMEELLKLIQNSAL